MAIVCDVKVAGDAITEVKSAADADERLALETTMTLITMFVLAFESPFLVNY